MPIVRTFHRKRFVYYPISYTAFRFIRILYADTEDVLISGTYRNTDRVFVFSCVFVYICLLVAQCDFQCVCDGI